MRKKSVINPSLWMKSSVTLAALLLEISQRKKRSRLF